jgi:hypothetical protein
MKIEDMGEDSSSKSSTNEENSINENTDGPNTDKMNENTEIKTNLSSVDMTGINSIDDVYKVGINDREKSKNLNNGKNNKNGKLILATPPINTDIINKINYKIVKEDSDDEDVLAPLSIILPFELTPSPDPSSYLSCLAYSLTTEEVSYF